MFKKTIFRCPYLSLLEKIIMLVAVLIIAGITSAEVIYVDVDAGGANNGTSWANAFNYLQDALTNASSFTKPLEINVAQGVYTPDSNSAVPHGTGDREATFKLINGVSIKGGYAGFGEANPDARDIELYETILSGDLDGNDVEVNDPCDLLNELTRAENSYHVVTGSDCNQTAILDGFIISGGNANGLYEYSSGGGMYNYQSSPTLINCVFLGNSASWDGGGIWCSGEPMCGYLLGDLNQDCCVDWKDLRTFTLQWLEPVCLILGCVADLDGVDGVNLSDLSLLASNWSGGRPYLAKESNPTLINCTFIENTAGHDGGGAQCGSDAHVTISSCVFRGNLSINGEGGAINLDVPGTSATLTDCIFAKNVALQGGAVECDDCSLKVANCQFVGNSTTESAGGAICFEGGEKEPETPILTNCVFVSNSSNSSGGAIANEFDGINVINCLFQGNKAGLGGAIYDFRSDPAIVDNCTFSGNMASVYGGGVYCEFDSTIHIRNCILWDDAPDEVYPYVGTPIMTYSDVQGGWPGEGNIDADPCFIEPGYWDENGTPDYDWDDYWVEGDYHLLLSSLCIDAGDPNYVLEPNEKDLDGNPRVINGRIDMGTYEFANTDTDSDGMPDWWEVTYGLDPTVATGPDGADGDGDSDGWRNIVEYLLRTEPNNSSSNGEDRLPIGWTTMEIEAKWTISEGTFNAIQSDFYDGSTYTINGISYDIDWKWDGLQKLYWDFYYDNSSDELSDGLHCLRKRRRFSSPYNDPDDRDYQRVQYKSDPYRFGAVWMRQEYKDDELSDPEAADIVEGDSITWKVNPESYTTVDAVLIEHPGFDESTLDDFLEVVDYRFKIDFEMDNVDFFTMSLDDVTSTYSGGSPEKFYELELEIIPMPYTAGYIEELFRIVADLEADYTLTPSTSSKGGLKVPESF